MIYNDGGVTVDKDFVRFGPKSYAINKINTVEIREYHPYGKIGLIICAFISGAAILSAVPDFTIGKLVVAAIFGALTYWFLMRSKIVEYRLFLMTSSSEAQAYMTRDQDEVFRLRAAIEGAMSRS